MWQLEWLHWSKRAILNTCIKYTERLIGHNPWQQPVLHLCRKSTSTTSARLENLLRWKHLNIWRSRCLQRVPTTEQKRVEVPMATASACAFSSDSVQVKLLIIYYFLVSFIQLLCWRFCAPDCTLGCLSLLCDGLKWTCWTTRMTN